MRIKDSANLHYDKVSTLSTNATDYDYLDFKPRICILESFRRIDGTILLYFKNGTHAEIKARNADGTAEINSIELKLPKLIKQSYQDILESEI